MQVELTYIQHNSFVLACEGLALLFDWPAPEHRPNGAVDTLRRVVGDRKLIVLASHGHADHFDPATVDCMTAVFPSREIGYVFSDDIGEMFPECLPLGANDAQAVAGQDASGVCRSVGDASAAGTLLLVEPDEAYAFQGLRICTFLSSDLGVAFLLAVPTSEGLLLIWHGGDLACWDWPQATAQEQAFSRSFFAESLERVRSAAGDMVLAESLTRREQGPHIAFQNCDPRLPSLGGGPEALAALEPDVFVPMHAFGNLDFVQRLEQRLEAKRPAVTRLFLYERSGESREFALSLS